MRFRRLLLLGFICGLRPVAGANEPTAAEPVPEFSLDAFAALGSSYAEDNRLAQLGWTPAQFEAFVQGLRDSFERKSRPLSSEAQALQNNVAAKVQALAASEAQRLREFFEDPARRESYLKQAVKNYRLERTDSGLAYRLESRGGSVRAEPEDTVIVSFTVTAPDGKTPLPQLGARRLKRKVVELMPGLAELVLLMTQGDTAMAILPPELSFASGAWPDGIDHNSPLLFVIELEEVLPVR